MNSRLLWALCALTTFVLAFLSPFALAQGSYPDGSDGYPGGGSVPSAGWQQSAKEFRNVSLTSAGANFVPYPPGSPNSFIGSGPDGYSLTLQGTLKTTFTWNGGSLNEPAPRSVLVKETLWPAAGAYQGSGSGAYTTNTGLEGNRLTRYEVKSVSNGALSVESPEMSASISGGLGSSYLWVDMKPRSAPSTSLPTWATTLLA